MTAIDDAIGYARRGWPVVALHAARDGACSCGRTECRSAAKHPRLPRGHDDATLDVETIRRWWARWPDANVGIRTGRASGLVVLDVDPRHDGDRSLVELERRLGSLPATPRVQTGGGGLHFYFARPDAERVQSRSALPGYPGLDAKCDGGFVVAPPSLHASGRRYTWAPGLGPDEIALALAPARLVSLVAAAARGSEGVATYTRETSHGQAVTARVARAIERDAMIRRRAARDASGLADGSPSGVDASLAGLLAMQGLDGAEIETALRESRAAAGLPARGGSYYRSTVGKALAFARPRLDRRDRVERSIVEGLRHA